MKSKLLFFSSLTRRMACILCLVGLTAALELNARAQESTPTPPAPSGTQAPEAGTNAKPAEDKIFHGVKVTDAKGKQTDATLILSDANKAVVVRVADHDFVNVPYGQLDKFSYEYTKKHRVTQGAIVMVASLGVGAVVMLTKSKSHWLYIDFHEQSAPKSIVLRMDKNEYKTICEAVKTHTGKEVEFLKDAGNKPKKEKEKDPDQEKDK
jgi:hypothetical protein